MSVQQISQQAPMVDKPGSDVYFQTYVEFLMPSEVVLIGRLPWI